ncbi:MAG: hypothetical protein PHF00_10565 [Elusimicrobia bacterium]|nr:hypothetical protein [Elusimicrobiota bacterium]
MQVLRAPISLALAASMLGTLPGAAVRETAAAVVAARARTASAAAAGAAAAVSVGGPVRLEGGTLAAPAPSAWDGRFVYPVAGLSAPAAAAAPGGAGVAVPGASARSPREPGEPTALQGLARELPGFDRMGPLEAKAGLERDFLGRVGRYHEAAPEAAVDAAPARMLSGPRAPGLARAELPAALAGPSVPAAVSLDDRPAELIVVFEGAPRVLSRDQHLSFVDLGQADAVGLYARVQQGMLAQLEAAGVDAEDMAYYGATPVATYALINAATIRVDAGRAGEFREFLEELGFRVYDNVRREFAAAAAPPERGAASLAESLRLSRAGPVRDLARGLWGEPEPGAAARFLQSWLGPAVPQPGVGVIGAGVDLEHPLLKRVKGAVNLANGPDGDEDGRGTWATSILLHYAPWLRTAVHYKASAGSGATADDILKALTVAAADGNPVIALPWRGDDPAGPESLLIRKLAERGHVLILADALVYRDPETGGARRAALAAGGRAEGAWPVHLDGADRIDPALGPLKGLAGSAAAAAAGAIVLLAMIFGVDSAGGKLDAVAGAAGSAPGPGVVDLEAAYDALRRTLPPVVPGRAARLAVKAAEFLGQSVFAGAGLSHGRGRGVAG